MYLFELVNRNPSVEDVRQYFIEQDRRDSMKITDEAAKAKAKEYEIDIEELNKMIDNGELKA